MATGEEGGGDNDIDKVIPTSILHAQTLCQTFCKQDLINCCNTARECCAAILQTTG